MVIDFERARLRKIKRANTDWWISENAVVAQNGMTYIAYTNDIGEIRIKEFSAKCSRTESKDICLCRLNCVYADEHNAPALCITKEGYIIVAYTGHGANLYGVNGVKYRITQKPYDLSSFGLEQTIEFDGKVTYVQLSENEQKGEIWLFTRVKGLTWQFCCSKDLFKTYTKPVTIIASEKDSRGLYYMTIRKLLCQTNENMPDERWFFAIYGHPYQSADHTIRSGIIDSQGNLCDMDGNKTDINLYSDNHRFTFDKLSTVYESTDGQTVRLLGVSPTEPYRVAVAAFKSDCYDCSEYYSIRYDGEKWRLSDKIAHNDEFLAPGQSDGSQTYVGGMAYYFGVGDAGYHHVPGNNNTDSINTDRIFLARTYGGFRLLESYTSADCGKTYCLEQTIRKIPSNEKIRIWRPTIPAFAQDNMPLYWHEGIYLAHTGGWHSDVNMYVEYDD